MLDWREAQARVVALGVPAPSAPTAIVNAVGRYAAEDLFARRSQPAQALSAMDGYAIRHSDMPGPWTVVGTAAAGAPMLASLARGEAARIFTGAFLPTGSDTVVIQEDVLRDGDVISLTGDGPRAAGASVRPRASDFAAGDCLIAAGSALTPARIALAAAGGHGVVAACRRLRVAIASTGDELSESGDMIADTRLPDANGPMLAALLTGLPVDVRRIGPIPDDRTELQRFFERAPDFDIIVTSGGASVGDHDLVRPVLLELGATLDFWKVAMRPGKPLMAGTLHGAVVLGLPGNPVSAFVTAILFLLPLIRQMSGARDPVPRLVRATAAAAMASVGPRTDFVRACWDHGRLHPLPSTDSGALSTLARADALIVREAGSPTLPPGQDVEALLLT